MTTETVEKDTARSQAKAQFESIAAMVDRLNHCRECTETVFDSIGECCIKGNGGGDYWTDSESYHDEDSAMQAIHEDPLEIQTRSDWHTPDDIADDTEYYILLCTGGPACRIIGEMHGDPTSARIQYQDWGTPWTDYLDADQDILLEYARQFIFAQ